MGQLGRIVVRPSIDDDMLDIRVRLIDDRPERVADGGRTVEADGDDADLYGSQYFTTRLRNSFRRRGRKRCAQRRDLM